MIIALKTTEIVALTLTILTSIMIPIGKKIIKKVRKAKENKIKQANTIVKISEKLDAIDSALTETKITVLENRKENADLKKAFDDYQIVSIKYMINDAFFGHNNIHEVPYETLLIATQGCDIYTGKGLNHEFGARCDIIYKELHRREQLKGEGIKHE